MKKYIRVKDERLHSFLLSCTISYDFIYANLNELDITGLVAILHFKLEYLTSLLKLIGKQGLRTDHTITCHIYTHFTVYSLN